MFKSYLVILFLMVVLSPCIRGQSVTDISNPYGKKGPVKLIGDITRIVTDSRDAKEFSSSTIDLTFQLTASNVSTAPILLLNREPSCSSVGVAKTVHELETRSGTYSFFFLRLSSQIISEAEWKKNRKLLDVAIPPPGFISILRPGETFSYDDELRIQPPKEGVRSLTPNDWPELSLKGLKALSPFYLKLQGCSPLGLGVEQSFKERWLFAKTIQRRWANVGELWLDDFESQPILVAIP